MLQTSLWKGFTEVLLLHENADIFPYFELVNSYQVYSVFLSFSHFILDQGNSVALQKNSNIRFEIRRNHIVLLTFSWINITLTEPETSKSSHFSPQARGNSETRFGFRGSKSIRVAQSHVEFRPLFLWVCVIIQNLE